MSQMNSKTVALNRVHQGQIGLQIYFNMFVFEKKLVFLYTFKLELCIDHLLVPIEVL